MKHSDDSIQLYYKIDKWLIAQKEEKIILMDKLGWMIKLHF